MSNKINNNESCQNDVMISAFFSVHSIKALENREFSIVRANIENTPENVQLARGLYDIKDWYFEFHNYKIDMRFVIS